MAEKKVYTDDARVVERAQDFWTRYNRPILIVSSVIILAAVGWFGYKYFIMGPKEEKANNAMFRAEEYYRMDSLQLALNGDGPNPGFLKIIDNYGGTKSGNLARFYAGDILVRTGDYAKAVSHLKKFETDSKLVQARAWKLLADAYAEQKNNEDAFKYYKKAGYHFKKDRVNSPEYLFLAAYLAHKVLNDTEEAKEIYTDIKDDYPGSMQAAESLKYLGQLGVYRSE